MSRPGSSGFDRSAYERLQLPRRLGESIAGWDDPEFSPAATAEFMRPDDYVLGVLIEGEARAYPLWIIDYYHVVNDRSGGRRFIVTSCERCGSGSAFWAEPPGSAQRDPVFRAGGLLNAALMLSDARSGSHWVHYEGRGVDRRASGFHLPWIPVVHAEWADWRALHPDTLVWIPPSDPRHPDARHGHGREEFFARPGMEPVLLETMTRSLDERYPENEMVLGVGDEHVSTAYPLREVHREGGVVHAITAEGSVAVFAGPRPDGISMGAFRSDLGTGALTFSRGGGAFVDAETRSRWTIEGEAVAGPLRGSRLEPVRSFYVRWHAWAGWHPTTGVFLSDREPARFGEHSDEYDTSELDSVLSTIADEGRDVRVVGPVVCQRRPRRSRASVEVIIDGDRLLLHAFTSEAAARDYEAVHGARTLLPMRPRILLSRLRRVGVYVLEAEPDGRYADRAQIVPTPWSELSWPAVLESGVLDSLFPQDLDQDVGLGLYDVIRALRLGGLDVVDVGLLPPAQLRVGCIDGLALTVDADRFLLYLFADEGMAAIYASTEPHSLAFGPFVMRSTPDTMYVHPVYEILYAGDDRVAWSRHLESERFASVLRAVATGENAPSTATAASVTR